MSDAKPLDGKRILITGGTGSLGKVLVRRLLSNEMGTPDKLIILSRDEAKQHEMRMKHKRMRQATEEIIYRRPDDVLEFRIGDVRDFDTVSAVMREVDVVFNAAALKQVPTCEYFPFEAVRTNIHGAENIVRAIQLHDLPVETVVGISTDKACKPVNVMGMCKALQERVFVQGNMRCEQTRFVCVRYGNVLASRGSVVPLFRDQILAGGPVTITSRDMTRFLLSLEDAVDTIFAAVNTARRGETYIPRVPSARVVDIAAVMIGERPVELVITGVRPGEKLDEILVSEEEAFRTIERSERFFAILPVLPELRAAEGDVTFLSGEFSSGDWIMDVDSLRELLDSHGLLDMDLSDEAELLV